MNIFKECTKRKIKVNTSKGNLTIQQLWDLNLPELKNAIINVKKKLKESNIEGDSDLSFLDTHTKKNTLDELRFKLLKEIYIDKKAEMDKIREEQENKEHNEKILAMIHRKQDSELESKSIEELKEQLR